MTRRKLFHRVIFTRALAVRVTEIPPRRVKLFRWPWERPPLVTIWEPEHLQLFKEFRGNTGCQRISNVDGTATGVTSGTEPSASVVAACSAGRDRDRGQPLGKDEQIGHEQIGPSSKEIAVRAPNRHRTRTQESRRHVCTGQQGVRRSPRGAPSWQPAIRVISSLKFFQTAGGEYEAAAAGDRDYQSAGRRAAH